MSDPTSSRPSRTTLVAIGLVALAAGGLGLHFLSAPSTPPPTLDSDAPPPGPAPDVPRPWRIAVLPLDAHGAADTDVGDALAQALIATLAFPDDVDAVAAPAPADGEAATWTDGTEAAASLEATHFVLGEVEGAAGALRVHVALRHREGALVRETELRASTDDVLTRTRDLALGLLGEGTVLPPADTDAAYASSTRSLAAMRAFVRGRRAAERGDDRAAAEAFQDALTADRAFSMAAYRRAEALERLGSLDLAMEAVSTALSNRDRLGHADLGRAEGLLAEWRGDYDRAVPLLRIHTTEHPSDVEGLVRLGRVRLRLGASRGRPPEDARAELERALELDPTNAEALEGLMGLEADRGDLDAFDALVERMPEADRPRFALVSAIGRGDAATAEAAADVAPARGPLLALPGLAGHEYLAVHDAPGGAIFGAEHDLAHGRPAAALERLAGVWDTLTPFDVERVAALLLLPPFHVDDAALAARCPDWSAPAPGIADADDPHASTRPLVRLYLSAACAHRLGHEADATAAVAALRAAEAPQEALGAMMAAQLEAWLALDSGAPARAIELLAEPVPPIPAWQIERSPILAMTLGRWVRAEAHRRLDQLGEALHYAQSLPHPRPASRALAAAALLMIAQVYQAAERTHEAHDAFERFLTYREAAEPAFAREVADARRQLEATGVEEP
ncbi:MAG: hypothetical protein H6719_33095 [Sandaracinaceae bacterium]|nr:hypothetical protein [Sandaracinaceae bacterium]